MIWIYASISLLLHFKSISATCVLLGLGSLVGIILTELVILIVMHIYYITGPGAFADIMTAIYCTQDLLLLTVYSSHYFALYCWRQNRIWNLRLHFEELFPGGKIRVTYSLHLYHIAVVGASTFLDRTMRHEFFSLQILLLCSNSNLCLLPTVRIVSITIIMLLVDDSKAQPVK